MTKVAITEEELNGGLCLFSVTSNKDTIDYKFYVSLNEANRKQLGRKMIMPFKYSHPMDCKDFIATAEVLEEYRSNPVRTLKLFKAVLEKEIPVEDGIE